MMKHKLAVGTGMAVLALLAALPFPVGAQAPPASVRLTLKQAIERGLQANLGVLVASTQVEEAAGARRRALARLLPRANGLITANVQTRNLKAFGLSFPGTPDIVGPFSNYDFRFGVDQAILDLQSYHRLKASDQREDAARLSYQDARDFIVRQVAALYLNAQSAAARTTAATARVTTAEALYKLAQDQHDAGVATGVDVLRAQVELANEQQRLLEVKNDAKQALLMLARAIGMSPGTPLELAEVLSFNPLAPPPVESAVAAALDQRSDYLALLAQRRAVREDQKAVRARYLPRIDFSGNYGTIGLNLGEQRSTGLVQGTVSIPLFDWDRRGEREEVDSRLARVDDQISDLRRGVEEEIREALLALHSASDQVNVAEKGRTLAERELDLARDRFSAGVTNNIEVITAQDALSRAQENYILALTRHADAKAALARALGGTEQNYDRYLGSGGAPPPATGQKGDSQ